MIGIIITFFAVLLGLPALLSLSASFIIILVPVLIIFLLWWMWRNNE